MCVASDPAVLKKRSSIASPTTTDSMGDDRPSSSIPESTDDAVVAAAKRSRSIQWRDEICSYHEGQAILDLGACSRDIWYQHTELAHMKRKAQAVAREAVKYGFGTLLANTYGRSSEDVQESLNSWTRNGQSRRGLERWINDEYAAKRSDIRRRTIQSVLRAQAKMQNDGVDDYEYGLKVLSRLSEAFSIDSRQFARCMAVADELALMYSDEDEDLVQQRKDKIARARANQHAAMRSAELSRAAATRLPSRPVRALHLSSPEESFRHFY